MRLLCSKTDVDRGLRLLRPVIDRHILSRGACIDISLALIADAIAGFDPSARDEVVEHILLFAFGLRTQEGEAAKPADDAAPAAAAA